MIDEERIQQLVDSKSVNELTKRLFVKELLAQLKSTAPIENENAAIRSILVSANKKLAGSELSSSSSSSSSKETLDVLRSQVILDLDKNNSIVIDESFSAKFGTVVWAKSSPTFPWWPSYVVDPRIISTLSVDVRKLAFLSINKKHCVYYYGSGEYGFVSDKQMRDYIDHRSEYELDLPKYRSNFEMALTLADNEAIIEPAFRTIYINTQIVSLFPSSPEEIEEGVGEVGNDVSAKRPRGRPKKITAATTKVAEETKDGEGGETTTVIVKSRGRTKKQEVKETIKNEPTKATSEILPTKPLADVIKKKAGRPPKKSIPENTTIASAHSSSSSSVKRTSSSISQVSADVTDQIDEPRQKIMKIEHRDSSNNGSTETKMDGMKKLIRCVRVIPTIL